MGNTQYEENDEIEIDLLEILLELKRRVLWILLAVVIGGAVFGLYSKLILVPKYSSTAMMYVLSKSGLYIHFHGVCIIKGNNTHFPG